MHFSIGIYDAEHLTTKGTAAMYIVFTGRHESKRRCAPVAQGVCGPQLRCSVQAPLEALTRPMPLQMPRYTVWHYTTLN